MSAQRRLAVLPVDDARGASTRYRVLAYLPALRAAGFDPHVHDPLRTRGTLAGAARIADLTRDVAAASRAEVVLVHRKMYPPPFAGRLRRAASRLVLDIDDAVDLPPPGRELDRRTRERYRRNFDATAAAADLVVCGNAELERRVPHERTVRLPTPVDTARFRPDALGPPRPLTLGWVGHSDNLRYLERLLPVLRELAGRHPAFSLIVVADRPPAIDGVPIEFRRWSLEQEISCFDGIAVGLMPLEDGEWARSKCAFKAIQYMALGIPPVVSPVGMNREVVEHGISGFLAADAGQWIEAIETLFSRPELAASIGAAGRRVVERRYSLAANAPLLIDALRGVGRTARC
ncbi:MAG TPA: glycosyltransferase family 4 protein [Candidatus Polarisedimenticolaceae bacterium]|nr:glycosyltransferase family 4 protein [Candidatus Polarisedimenticolaceae bacterium]